MEPDADGGWGMKIGLIDVDGHNGHPNLALMRLSAYHKALGGPGRLVEWV